MSIDRIPSNPALRLVQPSQSLQSTQPAQPLSEAQQVDSAGRSFDDVFQSQRVSRPNVSLIEAQRRLEKIRKIIAAQTHVPIHFEPVTPAPVRNNPYAPSYLKFPTNPAELNASSTEHAANE